MALIIPYMDVTLSLPGGKVPLNECNVCKWYTMQPAETMAETGKCSIGEVGKHHFDKTSVVPCTKTLNKYKDFPQAIIFKAVTRGLEPSQLAKCPTVVDGKKSSAFVGFGGQAVIGTAWLPLATVFGGPQIEGARAKVVVMSDLSESKTQVQFNISWIQTDTTPTQQMMLRTLNIHNCLSPKTISDTLSKASEKRRDEIASIFNKIGGNDSEQEVKQSWFQVPMSCEYGVDKIDLAQHAAMQKAMRKLRPNNNLHIMAAALQLTAAEMVHEKGWPADAASISRLNQELCTSAAARSELPVIFSREVSKLVAFKANYRPDAICSGFRLASINNVVTASPAMSAGEDQNLSGTDTVPNVTQRVQDIDDMLKTGKLLNGLPMTSMHVAHTLALVGTEAADCEDLATKTSSTIDSFAAYEPSDLASTMEAFMAEYHSNPVAVNKMLADTAVCCRTALLEVRSGGGWSGVTLGFAAGPAMGLDDKHNQPTISASVSSASAVFQSAVNKINTKRLMGHAFSSGYTETGKVALLNNYTLKSCTRQNVLESTAPTETSTDISTRVVQLTCAIPGRENLMGQEVAFDMMLAIKGELLADQVALQSGQPITALHRANPDSNKAFWQHGIGACDNGAYMHMASMTLRPTPPPLGQLVGFKETKIMAPLANSHAAKHACRCVHSKGTEPCAACPHCGRCEWSAHLRAVRNLADAGRHTDAHWQAIYRTATECAMCGKPFRSKMRHTLSIAALTHAANTAYNKGTQLKAIDIAPLPRLNSEEEIVGIEASVQEGSEEHNMIEIAARCSVPFYCTEECVRKTTLDTMVPFAEHYDSQQPSKVKPDAVIVCTTIPQSVCSADMDTAMQMASGAIPISFEREKQATLAMTRKHGLHLHKWVTMFIKQYTIE